MRHYLTACAGLALAVPALAQVEHYLMVPKATDGVMLFDPQNGAVINSSFIPRTGPVWAAGVSVFKAATQVENEIWVSVQANDTIYRFDLNGKYYGQITENLNNVRGIVYHDGTVYVVNQQSTPAFAGPAIHKFSPSGQHLGGFLAGVGPWDLAVVGNEAFITDGTNNNILRYNIDGTSLGIFHAGTMQTPQQIVAMPNGNFLVGGSAGTGLRGIYELDSAGTQVNFISTGTSGAVGIARLGNGNYMWTGSNIVVYDVATSTHTTVATGSGQYITHLAVNTAAVGACCFTDGTCQILSISACGQQDGVFRGDGVTCATAACPPMGACCFNDGTCSSLQEAYCTAAGGTWRGAGSQCGSVTCPTRLVTPVHSLGSSTAGFGIFFDLTAESNMTIPQIDFWPGASAGSEITVDIYTKDGSYVGFDGDPQAWTLVGTIMTNSAGSTTTSPVTELILPSAISIDQGATKGVYLVGVAGGARYRSSTSPNPVSDINLALSSDLTRTLPFGGTPTTGRRFAGIIHYTLETTTPPCYANCDGSTAAPVLNVADFGCFLQKFAAGDAYANCDGSTAVPVLNVADFGCFLQQFAAGCR